MLEEKIIFYHVVVLLAAVQRNWQRFFFFFSGGIGNCYIELCVLGARLNYLKKNIYIYLPLKKLCIYLPPF